MILMKDLIEIAKLLHLLHLLLPVPCYTTFLVLLEPVPHESRPPLLRSLPLRGLSTDQVSLPLLWQRPMHRELPFHRRLPLAFRYELPDSRPPLLFPLPF